MTPHDDAPAVGQVMRDELRERLADAAKFLRRCRGTEPVEFFEEHATACEEAAALLAPQGAREPEALVAALRAIVDMEPDPFDFPADWNQQVAACEECKRWKNHPIQQGICDAHRQPLWDRAAHEKSEQRRLHYRMRSVAREALDAHVLAAAPAEATERSIS